MNVTHQDWAGYATETCSNSLLIAMLQCQQLCSWPHAVHAVCTCAKDMPSEFSPLWEGVSCLCVAWVSCVKKDWLGLFLGSSALNDSEEKSNHKAPMPWTELLRTVVSMLPSSLKWWSPSHTEYHLFFVQVKYITQSCRCGRRGRFVRGNGMMQKAHQSWCRKLFYFYFLAYMFITYLNTLRFLSVEYGGMVKTGLPWAQGAEESPWGLAIPTHFPGVVHGPLWFDLRFCLGLKRRKMIITSAGLSFLHLSDDSQISHNTPSWEGHIKIIETNSSRHIVGVDHNSISICVTTPCWLGVSCLGMGMCHHIPLRSEASPYGQLYQMHATMCFNSCIFALLLMPRFLEMSLKRWTKRKWIKQRSRRGHKVEKKNNVC